MAAREDLDDMCQSYGKPIATGGFGEIFLLPVSPPIVVNGKQFKRIVLKVPKPNGVLELKGEVESLHHLTHENIVQILGMVEGPAPGIATAWQMALEYCETDLQKVVHGTDAVGKSFAECTDADWVAMMADFAEQIATGFVYIHGQHRPHLDIKPENVLLAKEVDGDGCDRYVCKLADFGMTFTEDPSADKNAIVHIGTWEYMPPECWKLKYGSPDKPSDIFSFGLMLWEMIAKSRVYKAFPGFDYEATAPTVTAENGRKTADVAKVAAWLAGGQRPGTPGTDCPVLLYKLMQACWVPKMTERPKAEDVHSMLQQIRATDGGWDPAPAAADPPAELSYDDLLAELGLTHKKDDLAGYLEEGNELRDLKQMDVADLTGDILDDDDLGLDDDVKATFQDAVAILRAPAGGGSPGAEDDAGAEMHNAWATLTRELGGEAADSFGTLAAAEAEIERLREEKEEKDEELANKDKTIAKKDVQLVAIAETIAANAKELVANATEMEQLRAQLEKLEGVPPQ